MFTSTENVLDNGQPSDLGRFARKRLSSSLTLTYTITVTDSEGAIDTQDVVITIDGTNDSPVITDGPDSENLTPTGSALTTDGSFTVTDLDLSDNVTSAVDSVAVSGTGASNAPGSLNNATVQSFLTVSPTATLNGTQTTAALAWNFNSGSETFDFLADGETYVMTFTVSATDDDGTPLSDTETVTITVTGGNNAPEISIESGDSATQTLIETDTTLTVSDTLTVTDSNVSDVVTSSVTGVVAGGTTTGLGSNNAALLAMFTSTPTVLDNSETSDTLTYDFDSGSEAFDYLANGESLTLTYTIEVEDSQGATDTQEVVITINGTNDAPVITDGPDAVGLTETDAGLTSTGTLTVSDSDRTDNVTAAVDSVAVTGTGSSKRSCRTQQRHDRVVLERYTDSDPGRNRDFRHADMEL